MCIAHRGGPMSRTIHNRPSLMHAAIFEGALLGIEGGPLANATPSFRLAFTAVLHRMHA
jgi:hypothetical protein